MRGLRTRFAWCKRRRETSSRQATSKRGAVVLLHTSKPFFRSVSFFFLQFSRWRILQDFCSTRSRGVEYSFWKGRKDSPLCRKRAIKMIIGGAKLVGHGFHWFSSIRSFTCFALLCFAKVGCTELRSLLVIVARVSYRTNPRILQSTWRPFFLFFVGWFDLIWQYCSKAESLLDYSTLIYSTQLYNSTTTLQYLNNVSWSDYQTFSIGDCCRFCHFRFHSGELLYLYCIVLYCIEV